MNLDIIKKELEHGFELQLIGELDAYTAPDLKKNLLPLLDGSITCVTLDLGQTSYMDSTGIGVMIAAYKASKQSQTNFVIQNLTPRVKRLFDITGLSEIVKIDAQEEEEKA
ncbi:STAS domain-containing protein [Camelliibacillus cellulosilyticus]|uniref:Anti-sigma factor antagonist n=1 Tax=Camelliibacillus cellulosilyticus TaxID=2174486 RepID=A0ABV9GNQ8_9BACL